MWDEIKCVDIFNFYVNATYMVYMMTDLNDFLKKKGRHFLSPLSLCAVV